MHVLFCANGIKTENKLISNQIKQRQSWGILVYKSPRGLNKLVRQGISA